MSDSKHATVDNASLPFYQPLFLVRTQAPSKASLGVVGQDRVETSIFGTAERKRVFNLRSIYEPSFPAVFTVEDVDRFTAEPLSHPLDLVMAEGARTDYRSCFQRLRSLWLLAENRAGQIDNDPVLPFRHQSGLVHHILNSSHARRLLVADEVGLGKTVEAGLVIKELLRRDPGLKVLYITLGGLVENVLLEFERLDLPRWYYLGRVSEAAADEMKAVPLTQITEDTRLVVASIHMLCSSSGLEYHRQHLGESRFDVIIVDECHTLRAYGESADKQQIWFRSIRALLDEHLVADGRVMFLSATPHQGNREVFLNLVSLCTGTSLSASEAEKAGSARGKVIFRIKEHIRDWEGKRIFPLRDVRLPQAVAPPANYQNVLDQIAEHFDWLAKHYAGTRQARALPFVKSQALQFAASSLRAGFAYLLRRLIRYYPTVRSDAVVRAWANRLLPYRDAINDVHRLLERFASESVDPVDIESGELHDEWLGVEGVSSEKERLLNLLSAYNALFDDAHANAKFVRLEEMLDGVTEPVVVFSQSVETVYEIERQLVEAGREVYRLSGDMSPDARKAAIRSFVQSGTSDRVLVSSAAGGIGINLQVARRVIHFDLPWNPMVLEQRVGRVHRIGSTRTIIVDTLLLAGTRESDVFARLSTRLESIVASLSADPEERQSLYRRIFSSLDVDRLRAVFSGAGDLNEIGAAVDAGRRSVEEAESLLSAMSQGTHEVRGRAEGRHLISFLHDANIGLSEVGERRYAVISEVADGELESRELTAPVYRIETHDEPLMFDRTAASYLQLRRHQTGGIGHRAIDALLAASIEVPIELQKARLSTWVSASAECTAVTLEPGAVILFEVSASIESGRFKDARMSARVLVGDDIRELTSEEIESILWASQWNTARRAGSVPDRDQLFRLANRSNGPELITWPIAAIGIREHAKA